MKFVNLSVKYKLLGIIMLACTVSVLSAAFIIGYFSTKNITEQTINDLKLKSEIVAESLQAAVAFEDNSRIAEILSVFKTHPEISAVCLFNADNVFIDGFFKNEQEMNCESLHGSQQDTTNVLEGTFFTKPININDHTLGHLITVADISRTEKQTSDILGFTIGSVIFVSLLIAFPLASRLQRIISQPITQLDKQIMTLPINNKVSGTFLITKDEISRIREIYSLLISEIEDLQIRNNNNKTTLNRNNLNYQLALRYLEKQTDTLRISNELNLEYFISNKNDLNDLNALKHVNTIQEMLEAAESLSQKHDDDIRAIQQARELTLYNNQNPKSLISYNNYEDLVYRAHEEAFEDWISPPELHVQIPNTTFRNTSSKNLAELFHSAFNFMETIVYEHNEYRLNIILKECVNDTSHSIEINCHCINAQNDDTNIFNHNSEETDLALFLMKHAVNDTSNKFTEHNLTISFIEKNIFKMNIIV